MGHYATEFQVADRREKGVPLIKIALRVKKHVKVVRERGIPSVWRGFDSTAGYLSSQARVSNVAGLELMV